MLKNIFDISRPWFGLMAAAFSLRFAYRLTLTYPDVSKEQEQLNDLQEQLRVLNNTQSSKSPKATMVRLDSNKAKSIKEIQDKMNSTQNIIDFKYQRAYDSDRILRAIFW